MGQDKDLPIVFLGGMDQDSDIRSITDGDFIDALNTRNAITDQANKTAVENVRGNIKINNPYLSTGVNKVVGSFEDQKDDSIIYCVYNSNGYHGIYRYFRNKPEGGTGTIEKLLQINYPTVYTITDNPLNFQPDKLITGHDLIGDKFYWTDFHNRSRKINTIRANDTDKRYQFHAYFNQLAFNSGGTTYTINVYDPSGTAMTTPLTWTSSATTLVQACEDLMAAYHQNQEAVLLMNITNTGEYIEIELTSTGNYFITFNESTGTFVHLVVPQNFYPDKNLTIEANAGITTYDYFSQDLIDRLKYPPFKEPSVQYKTDLTRNTNLVRQKVFQFRCQYVYDDDEKSVWGAISIIPLASSSCDESVVSLADNYIEVDFTDPRLNNPSLSCIIKRVNIAVREHNEGDWQIIDSLQPHQWGVGRNTYKFYNDKVFTQLADQNEFIRPFDALFIKHKAQKLVNDRLFDACGVEGYDKTNVDAEINITYSPPPNQKRYTIKGVIFIRGIYAQSGSPGMFYQPIHRYDGNAPVVFGGYDYTTPLPDTSKLWANRQNIPSGGWPVYLAGTDYCGISYQQQVMPYPQNPFPNGAQYAETTTHPTVFATITSADQLAVGLFVNGANPYPAFGSRPANDPFGLGYGATDQNGNLIGDTNSFSNCRVFSYFEIPNVPAGEYVLRIADHLTTQSQINDGTRNYQKTSANVLEVGGFNGQNGNGYEAKIKIDDTTAINGIVYVGRTSVADTSNGYQIQGYITDHDNSTVNTTQYSSLMYNETTRIERAVVSFPAGSAGGWNDLVTTAWYSEAGYFIKEWNNLRAYCDHNGYFFFSTRSILIPLTVSSARSGARSLNLSVKLDDQSATWTGLNTRDTKVGVFRNTDADVSKYSRTKLKGKVLSGSGSGVPNVLLINTHGAIGQTDFFGDYEIFTYVDSYRHDYVLQDGRKDEVVFNAGNSGCFLTFNNGDFFGYDITINQTAGAPPPYDSVVQANYYFLPLQIASLISNAISTSAFKKGGDIQFGIAYYDEGDRRCAVCTIDDLKVHFPFQTEPLGNTGIPIVSWKVNHEPPSWAKKWQWVRTKNTQLNFYLQWMVDSVEYVLDDNTTVVSQNNATKIKISIANFAKFKEKHPNSTLDYTFSKGDRVRFFGTNFTNYFDYEILEIGTSGDYFTIYNDFALPALAIGDLYEIYTPRDKQNFTVFYEFGETYEVGTAYFGGIKKNYHKGQIADQVYGNAPLLQLTSPATGVFKSGDAYYRLRIIPVNSSVSPLAFRTALVADGSVSDFYSSEDDSIGRTNTNADDIGQIFRPTAIRFSDRYVEDTKINGLSTMQPLNQKQLSTNYGKINKLMLLGDDVLMVIHENSKIVTMYVNKNVLRQASGTTPIVALSDEVLPQSSALMQTYGTQHAESVTVNDERDVFMWDKQIATVPRYTGNALTPISDFKMSNFFRAISELQLKYPKDSIKTISIYDRLFDEFILTFCPIPKPSAKKATARVCIPFLDRDTEFVITYSILQTQLARFTLTAPTLVSPSLVNEINTGGTGFSAIFDSLSGCVDIYAPETGLLYNNTAVVVTMKYIDDNGVQQEYSLQFEMKGGTL